AFVGDKGGGAGRGWRTIGRDAADTRDQPFEHIVGPANVSRLAPKWIATTAGDVSATPVVAHHAVYFPDWGGMLWKLDAQTGAVIWSHPISDYTGIPASTSCSTRRPGGSSGTRSSAPAATRAGWSGEPRPTATGSTPRSRTS